MHSSIVVSFVVRYSTVLGIRYVICLSSVHRYSLLFVINCSFCSDIRVVHLFILMVMPFFHLFIHSKFVDVSFCSSFSFIHCWYILISSFLFVCSLCAFVRVRSLFVRWALFNSAGVLELLLLLVTACCCYYVLFVVVLLICSSLNLKIVLNCVHWTISVLLFVHCSVKLLFLTILFILPIGV